MGSMTRQDGKDKPAVDLPKRRLPEVDLRDVAKALGPNFGGLGDARIFLSGGTGFLGRWLLESWLLARKEALLHGELVVLTREPERWASALGCPGLSFVGGDQTDFGFPEGTFDLVIHGAFEHGDARKTFWNNLLGCRHMLDFARQAHASRFLLLSSGAVYGSQSMDRVPETWPGTVDPLDPRQAYGSAKRASEALGAAFQADGGPAFVSARGFAFLGPGLPLDQNYAIGNFIRDALRGGPIRIQGDGTPYRSYLYASDAAAWFWALLARGDGAVNVGSPEALSILQVAQKVRDTLAPEATIEVAGRPLPGTPPSRYVPDTTRAEALGLRPRIGLEEGLRRTAAWSTNKEGA